MAEVKRVTREVIVALSNEDRLNMSIWELSGNEVATEAVTAAKIKCSQAEVCAMRGSLAESTFGALKFSCELVECGGEKACLVDAPEAAISRLGRLVV
jgi:hypothetical protein